ncbi:MAG: hypothetical protein IJN96_02970 [Clostridia bacterium]|nr:hypothetical protein [Clostridia bacterium]
MDFEEYIGNMEDAARNNEIGSLLAAGIGVGLSKDSYLAITAMENVYVELDNLTKNAAKNYEKHQKKTRERELKNLKNALNLKLLTEQEYYEALKVYRDEKLKEGSDLWYKVTEEIAAYNIRVWTDALEEQEKAAQKALKTQQWLAEKIAKEKERLADKLNENSTPLVESEKITFHNTGAHGRDEVFYHDTINDFRKDIDLINRFRDAVLALSDLGYMPDGFFAEIAEMDVAEAVSVMEKILGTDELKRRQFADGYHTKSDLANLVSEELFDILNNELVTEYQNQGVQAAIQGENIFAEHLKEYFEIIPQEYYELGESSGAAFGEGVESGLTGFLNSDARAAVLNSVNGLAEGFFVNGTDFVQGIYDNSSVYNNTYNFNAHKETVTEQIFAAKSASIIDRLRGVN